MNVLPLISIVVPVFNEEANLEELIRRCLEACGRLAKPFEIILVDDGSIESSPEMIAKAAEHNVGKVVGVLLNKNYGQHAAVMAGFAESNGDIVVTLDADLQNPPEEIPKLVERIEDGFDVVGSVRVHRRDTLFRRAASFMINKVEAMLKCHERSTFIPALANSFARNTTEIDVNHEERSNGNSKYGFFKLINLQFDLLTSVTTSPLRLLSMLGGIMSAVGVGFGLFLFVMRLIHGPDWAAGGVFTLFAVLFIFIGGQFIGMGLLGEYIGRIYHDVRARPRYFVHRVIGRSK